ncbi:MAG TPA: beta-ketoacyl synthase N-terminal-like domain-containing protein, partial [Micromonosporaceae bacterium]|nr:beta-ketoacyl synthase N-terminal-like domain-containing protein [Micromonosporaceae bacterium]
MAGARSQGEPTRSSAPLDAPREPIAIIGLACRLPGAPDPAAFWRLLCAGRDAITLRPPDRRGTDVTVDPHNAPHDPSPGTASSGLGGYLDQVDHFDAAFFGISPREAAAMDPQQRLMLELSWESLEDAGIVPADLDGSRTGVFVGAIWDDYATLLHRHGVSAITPHTVTGVHRSIIANRVSYALRLRGPSMVVDTGQSSSLVAVHVAGESLRSGECDLALAGGVNLNLAADSDVGTTKLGALSPDGRCYTFDARANGYVRGEGAGLVVLKPLSRALSDGDSIYCVLLGSSVNNDGGGDGLTVPSPQGQAEVLRRAYRQAGVDPAAVQYVELHGTATTRGDPVEAAALGAVLGAGRPADRPLAVGSVKTNVGHLEGAAGVTGLLKVALAVRNRKLPPSLNYATPNPRIPLDELRLRVHTELTRWPSDDAPLVAGVSAFGMGGTNCHVVAAEAPLAAGARPAVVPGAPDSPPAAVVGWAVSAHTAAALRAQARRLREHADADPALDTTDIAYSLATTRSSFTHRAVVVAGDRAGYLRALDALAAGEPSADLVHGRPVEGPVAVLFSGQGSQRPGMGRQLYPAFPTFAEALDTVCAHLDPSVRTLLLAEPTPESSAALDQTAYAQPALFAVEVALYRLVESWGLRPDYLLGHSIGELTAAHAAGVLSLPDAAALVCARGQLMQALPAGGAMVSLQATEDEVRRHLDTVDGQVGIAAVNGPTATVVSGDAGVVAAVAAHWAAQGRRTRRLRVSHAFHSARMEDMTADLRRVAEGLTFAAPSIPVISNLTGEPADADMIRTPGYWARHARQAVRFADGVHWLRDQGVTTYLELGPDGALAALARECHTSPEPGTSTRQPAFVATLRRDSPEVRSLALALGVLHVRGVVPAWPALLGGEPARRVPLPTYAFQRRRYWLDPLDGAAASTPASASPPPQPLAQPPSPALAQPPSPAPDGEPAAAGADWRDRLAGLAEPAQVRAILGQLCRDIAMVLRHRAGDDIDTALPFKALGFDSLTAVELRDRLVEATGLTLPPGVLFDYPTPDLLATHLRQRLLGGSEGQPGTVVGTAIGEPVAIIGMACRYPGGVSSPEDLWRLVVDGTDAIGGFPTDREWDLDRLYDPDPDRPGTSYAREGGFLYDAAGFDAELFGISPREALAMDPQQRLMLETA